MKKRGFTFGLVLCAAVTMLFAGCGSDEASSTKPYDYDLSEYIVVGEYKGVEVTEPASEVETGDTVNIDFVGKMDGEAFEGGTASGTALTIGSGQFIPGFEDGLVGASQGDVKVLNLEFPEGYQTAELAGKPVEFTVTINSITKGDDMENRVWNAVMENVEVLKYPEKELAERQTQQKEYYEAYAKSYNLEFTDFLEQAMGYTEEQFEEAALKYSQEVIGMEMAIQAIAKAEDITVSEEEYAPGMERLIKEAGFEDEAAFKEQNKMSFEEYAGKENIEMTLLMEEVIDFIVAESVIVPAK